MKKFKKFIYLIIFVQNCFRIIQICRYFQIILHSIICVQKLLCPSLDYKLNKIIHIFIDMGACQTCSQMCSNIHQIRLPPKAQIFQPALIPENTNQLVTERMKLLEKTPLSYNMFRFGNNIQQLESKIHQQLKFVYKGTWKQDIPCGVGKVYFPNGEYFEGQMQKGKANGKGRHIFINGDYYEGDFVDSKAQGKGKFCGRLIEYDGFWYDSKPTIGIYTYKDPVKQIKIQSQKKGQIKWENGTIYSGEIKNLAPDGQGEINFSNQDRYIGRWKNGLMQGFGNFTWANGESYKGEYDHGKKDGQGQYTYSNGKKYKGQWKDGMPFGHGQIIQQNNVVQSGYFQYGQKVETIQSKLLQIQQRYKSPVDLKEITVTNEVQNQ